MVGVKRGQEVGRPISQVSGSFVLGLTRAILETFPIVKFGTSTPETQETTETTDTKMPLPDTTTRQLPQADSGFPIAPTGTSNSPLNSSENNTRAATAPSTGNEVTEVPASPGSAVDTIPAGIGRETCPICILPFEEGEDLRVLPCDGAHRFHQSCVDPWLLELSTSCPLCRHDFIALENMISGGSEVQDPDSNHRTSRLRRFSRYIRFARHGDVGDATRPSTAATRPSTTDSDTRLLHQQV